MNKRQKSILFEIIIVLIVTVVAVIGMINIKDLINRSEAIRAMRPLRSEFFNQKNTQKGHSLFNRGDNKKGRKPISDLLPVLTILFSIAQCLLHVH